MSLLTELVHTLDSGAEPPRKRLKIGENVVDCDYNYFFDWCLPALCKMLNDREENEILDIIHKCIFEKNAYEFQRYLHMVFGNKELPEAYILPKLFFKALCTHYQKKDHSAIYLLYLAFCKAFGDSFLEIYQLTLLLLEVVGFGVLSEFSIGNFKPTSDKMKKDITTTLNILSDVYKVISEIKIINSNVKINDIHFSEITKLVLLTVINIIKEPCDTSTKFIVSAIDTDPLLLEPVLPHLIPYMMLDKIDERNPINDLLVKIFEVFSKLHRLPNFLSTLLSGIKNTLEGQEVDTKLLMFRERSVNNSSKVKSSPKLHIPQKVLDSFTLYTVGLATWQVINVFKTFLFNLGNFVNELRDSYQNVYVETLSTLFCQFLSSIKITDANVKKCANAMLELKKILSIFGNKLLAMNHNHCIMRSYLNICYVWGELYIVLNYYFTEEEILALRCNKNDVQVCCYSYVHSYLTEEQWCLVIERVTNFGEWQCKKVIQSIQLQSVKAVYLFEEQKEDVDVLFLRNCMQNQLMEHVLTDPFVIKELVPRLQSTLTETLSKSIIKHSLDEADLKCLTSDILNSPELVKTIVKHLLVKMSRCGIAKEPIDKRVDVKEMVKTLFNENNVDDIIKNAKVLCQSFTNYFENFTFNDKMVVSILELIVKLPILGSEKKVQYIVFFYMTALLATLKNEEENTRLKSLVEDIITGIFQFPSDLLWQLEPAFIVNVILHHTKDHKLIFSGWLENISKDAHFIDSFKAIVKHLVKKFKSNFKSRECIVIVLNALNKYKKYKIFMQNKEEINKERETIHDCIVDWLSNKEKTREDVIFYALALKYCFSTNSKHKAKLFKDVDSIMSVAVSGSPKDDIEGKLLLFTVILSNKNQLDSVDDKIISKVWTTVKSVKVGEELKEQYRSLLVLIFEHLDHEEFSEISSDMCNLVASSLLQSQTEEFSDLMSGVACILQCTFNPVKTKVCQKLIQSVLQLLVDQLKTKCNDVLYTTMVVTFEKKIIQATNFMLTATMVDDIFRSISTIMLNSTHFIEAYTASIAVLSLLLKNRLAYITDRLPSYLQQYRLLLTKLCKESDSSLKLDASAINELSVCAHEMEKWTRNLVRCDKHVKRLAPYITADVLRHYEEISIFSSVKIHIDNCIYALMSLCDQHAVSFLMRSLSTASTELFNYMYNNYKKHYRFTGKV